MLSILFIPQNRGNNGQFVVTPKELVCDFARQPYAGLFLFQCFYHCFKRGFVFVVNVFNFAVHFIYNKLFAMQGQSVDAIGQRTNQKIKVPGIVLQCEVVFCFLRVHANKFGGFNYFSLGEFKEKTL